MSDENGNTKKKYAAYIIIESFDSERRDFWQRIGTAFENKDGSINVLLNAAPMNGKLHLRVDAPRKEAS